jgi:hypothetical protein
MGVGGKGGGGSWCCAAHFIHYGFALAYENSARCECHRAGVSDHVWNCEKIEGWHNKVMGDYTITVDDIVSWFGSKEHALETAGVVLAGIHERRGTDKPAAFADYDTDLGTGRITIWVSGEAEFEVLRRSDGKNVMVRHEHVSSLNVSSFQSAFDAFLVNMAHSGEQISK